MRSLEECKAEVFLRSYERIRERRQKRKRVLLYGIPLCLLLAVGGVFLHPLFLPMDELGIKSAEDYVAAERELGGVDCVTSGNVLSGSTASYTSVGLTDKTGVSEVSREITDAKLVGALCDSILLYFPVAGERDGTVEEIADGTEAEGLTAGQDRDTIKDELQIKYTSEEKPADYLLVFRSVTGEMLRFRLHENNLYNETDDGMVVLSDAQLAELKIQLERMGENEGEK